MSCKQEYIARNAGGHRLLNAALCCLLPVLASCGGGGGDSFYISPCFPFPESWCTTNPGDTTSPTAPLNLLAETLSPAIAELSWDGSTDNVSVIGYRIYRDETYIRYVDGSTTKTTDTGLEALTIYCYRVTATDSSGNESLQSNQSCTTTLQDTTPPSVPAELTVTYVAGSDGSPSLNLGWSASSDDGIIAGYEIYRDGAFLASTAVTTYADYQINPLTNYCYAVLAYDKSGNASVLSDPECATSAWSLSVISSGENPANIAGIFDSIDMDSIGIPHLCYVGARDDWDGVSFTRENRLKYAYKVSGEWSFIELDSYSTDDVHDLSSFAYPAIAIDTGDRVHIAYIYSNAMKLNYLSNVSGVWETETVVENAYITGSSMALDTDGNAHIGFVEWGDVRYATNRNGMWVTGVVEDIVNQAHFPSIVADQQKHIHMSYYDYTGDGGSLKYATNTSGEWVVTMIATAQVGLDFYPSITADPSGGVHIIYSDKNSRTLVHASNAGGTWLKTVINNDVEVEEMNDVDIDPAGNLHISYVDTIGHILLYSTNMNGEWETHPVDAGSWVKYPPAIAVGSDNALHIVYRGDTELRYATTQ
jgi:chitodextrinase